MNINYMSLTLFCLFHQSFPPKSTMSRLPFKEGDLLHLNSSLPLKDFLMQTGGGSSDLQFVGYLCTSCTQIWGSQTEIQVTDSADDHRMQQKPWCPYRVTASEISALTFPTFWNKSPLWPCSPELLQDENVL